MNNESDELEDTHLCIKCNATIVGLSKYIEHRKSNCLSLASAPHAAKPLATPTTTPTSTSAAASPTIMSRSNLEHSYGGFHFHAEAEPPSSHGGKGAKLTEAYDLNYELGADVFFSSLKLQSVSTGGKTSARAERAAKEESSWHASTDPLLKAVRDNEDAVYQTLKFVHSPEPSEEEEEEDDEFEGEGEGEEYVEHEADADEDYETRRHSPPTVPASHTGGKWRPEQRPHLRHTHLARLSPSWDEPSEELGVHELHPPAEHTHGKWVPGSKQLEYRENIDLTKLQPHQESPPSFWCNICCRRLKSRSNYDQHLRSGYHQRRADAEQQLAQANLEGVRLTLSHDFDPANTTASPASALPAPPPSQRQLCRRRRRANFIRCDVCRHSMARHLIGKHLISHYHYRRLQQQQTPQRRQQALHDILQHMGSIVRQAPFQCLPCRFYANTEASFQDHWRSAEHLELTNSLGGNFWCSFCQFECGSNDVMLQHLSSAMHKEVLLALNRSVPVSIAQRRALHCSVCNASFLYNAQLRRHLASEHAGQLATGSAADDYQCRFHCALCGAAQKSRVALQRHEKHKHRLAKYFCAICRLEFETPQQARRHRSLVQHKRRAQRAQPRKSTEQEIEQLLRQVLEDQESADASGSSSSKQPAQPTLMNTHSCLSCGSSFQSAQALGRHTRSCQPPPAPAASAASSSSSSPSSKSWACDQCSFKAQYEADLLYHRFYHTRSSVIGKQELLRCPLCPKQFRKHSLRAHLRNHTNERIFECGQCQAKFARRHNLKAHVSVMHDAAGKQTKATEQPKQRQQFQQPKAKFTCSTCGKVLAKKYSLKLHERTHTATAPSYRCHQENCQYAGLTAEGLKIHMASHAEGEHKCPHENCSYVGKSTLHLKRHLKSHATTGERFGCSVCEFSTRIKAHLKRHMQRHTGAKPIGCPHCEFQCSSLDVLRKHILKTGKHPGKCMYECATCKEQEVDNRFQSNSHKEYQMHLATHQQK
ncbi:zinc finger protein 615 [Drosophila busckii]|uniref:zinc finger protein 615 n=1 Tax=Drosophila busckii TaxID=30019 RepID=UPI00083F204B|nr:zinc finger protein 615 [Drosophila busckii]